MALDQFRRAVGVFANAQELAYALNELRDSGFPMTQVSAISKDPILEGANRVQEGATTGAIAGGAVGGIMGLLAGLSTAAAIPGIGPIVFLGAAATALATTLTSGVMGAAAGGLLGALLGYGVPKEHAQTYSDRLHRGEYLVMIEGSEADIREAEAVLSRWRVQEFRIFDTPTVAENLLSKKSRPVSR